MLSAIASQHVHSPRNVGPLEGATHYGQVGIPGEGRYMQLWLQVEDGRIKRTGYAANGCFASIAAASVVAEIIKGRTLGQAARLDPNDVDVLLKGLPEGKKHCAEMAIQTLSNAILGGMNQ